jgi:hypothetical protein
LEHLEELNTNRRRVRYSVCWKMTDADETAIAQLPASAWTASIRQDGTVQDDCHVAELTGLSTSTVDCWPG